MRTLLTTVAAVSASATMWIGGVFDSGPRSRPDFVATACRSQANARACSIALRYLAALDLDRAREACALLDRPTLEAAGGMTGCAKTLLQARGTRIHYSVAAVLRSPLGRTIRFTTRAGADAPLRQQMLISPAGRIVAVVPEP